MSLFGPYFVFLRDFGAHLTRLACRFCINIKYKNVIGLEIFSRKILLQTAYIAQKVQEIDLQGRLFIFLLLLLLYLRP